MKLRISRSFQLGVRDAFLPSQQVPELLAPIASVLLIVIILYTTTQILVAWMDLNHRPRLDRAFAESFSFIASRALPTELHATLVAEVDLEPTCHSATAIPAPLNLATLCGI